ncbi:MAG TPA: asparagine synthase (glutamine-hydrolyzing), partial [Cytophagaceae bacterium]|nr:asparagine synthase (glutamine-hydrolyzing) [Cytophagaceae bacterium]
YFHDDVVGLGHRRLSIIDLSDAANQPVYSACGNYVIVFNGEIYNYKELASLVHRPLRTHGDTEVIIELFVQYGESFVSYLNGMFAFAIYDIRGKELFICRDRMGVKPLVYFWDGSTFVFASEIKSLLELPRDVIKREVNTEAIAAFLHLNFIPDPLSAFKNIYKLESGSYMKYSGGALSKKTYWSINDKIKDQVVSDEKEATAKVEELLLSSIAYRMISDVPIGSFLSGGVDSSLVTAIMQKLSPRAVNSFSIGFKESKFNEANYAKEVARHLGTKHHEFILSEKDALEKVDTLFDSYDEPFADISAIPTLLVSQMAKSNQVKVCLTGDGGDELFHGYNRYLWPQRLSHPVVRAFRHPIAFMFNNLSDKYKSAAQLIAYQSYDSITTHIHSQEAGAFSLSKLNELLNNNVKQFDYLVPDNPTRKLTKMEKQSLFDLSYYLRDDLLYKIDIASMHYALELREPLLDYRLIEYVLNIDPALKYKNGDHKYILKQVLYKYLPEELFKRPKWGFTAPIKVWLRTDLNYLIEKYLSREKMEKAALVNIDVADALLSKYKRGSDIEYQRIWSLICLHRWYERFFN